MIHMLHINEVNTIFFVAFVILKLLSLVNVQVKLTNVDGTSKSSSVIINVWISQGTVATQLRVGGKPCNTKLHRKFPWESVSERILKIGVHLPKLWSKVFFETQCICWRNCTQNLNFQWSLLELKARTDRRTDGKQCVMQPANGGRIMQGKTFAGRAITPGPVAQTSEIRRKKCNKRT